MRSIYMLLVSISLLLQNNVQAQINKVLKPGSRLIYSVSSSRGSYDFVVTLIDKKGTAFNWEMGSPADIKGKIIHTSKALQEGYIMFNYFRSETKQLDDKTLSVWISQQIFKALSKGGEPVKVGMSGPDQDPIDMQKTTEGSFTVTVNGKEISIKDMMVKPVKKENEQWVADQSNDMYFTYNMESDFPVILRMNAGFTLQLKEIKTN